MTDEQGEARSPPKALLRDGPPTREEMLVHYPAKFTWIQLKTFINSGYVSETVLQDFSDAAVKGSRSPETRQTVATTLRHLGSWHSSSVRLPGSVLVSVSSSGEDYNGPDDQLSTFWPIACSGASRIVCRSFGRL